MSGLRANLVLEALKEPSSAVDINTQYARWAGLGWAGLGWAGLGWAEGDELGTMLFTVEMGVDCQMSGYARVCKMSVGMGWGGVATREGGWVVGSMSG